MTYSRWKFARALLIAALFSDLSTIEPYRRAWRALKAILGRLDVGEKCSPEKSEARMRCCEGCSVYSHRFQTCGSPLDSKTKGLGCFCYLPVIAQIESHTCWLDQEGLGDVWGWSKIVDKHLPTS